MTAEGWTGTHGFSENIADHARVAQWWGYTGEPETWEPEPGFYDENEAAMARGLVQGWMSSLGHRRNILDPSARRIGVGVAFMDSLRHNHVSERVYATQNFSACQ